MTKETMTIHEALAALKIIDKRLDKASMEPVVYTNKHSNTKIGGKPVAEVVETITANHKSVMDLVRRRAAIKNAVSKSNASTEIIIGGKKYTVAEAIEMKRSGMYYQRVYAAHVMNDYASSKLSCDKANDILDKKADEYVVNLLGPKDKVPTEDAENLRRAYIDANTVEIVTANGIMDDIKKLNDELDTFEAEVDAKLSISNAVTVIEVEY